MKRLLILAPLLAALVAGASACDSATDDQAQPQSVASSPAGRDNGVPSEQPSSSASRSSERNAGRGKLAEIDTCKLVTQEEGQKYQIARVERVNLGGARACQYFTADSEFVLTLGIRERQGINEYNRDYGPARDTTIDKYPAIRQETPSGGCATAVGITESSRIDVDIEAGNERDKACTLSREFAQIVASKVTPG